MERRVGEKGALEKSIRRIERYWLFITGLLLFRAARNLQAAPFFQYQCSLSASLEMTSFWISLVPSPIVHSLASR